eukprot:1186277-Prorocentrum_minimum.AAC.3
MLVMVHEIEYVATWGLNVGQGKGVKVMAQWCSLHCGSDRLNLFYLDVDWRGSSGGTVVAKVIKVSGFDSTQRRVAGYARQRRVVAGWWLMQMVRVIRCNTDTTRKTRRSRDGCWERKGEPGSWRGRKGTGESSRTY